jgi:hypothetical protein
VFTIPSSLEIAIRSRTDSGRQQIGHEWSLGGSSERGPVRRRLLMVKSSDVVYEVVV